MDDRKLGEFGWEKNESQPFRWIPLRFSGMHGSVWLAVFEQRTALVLTLFPPLEVDEPGIEATSCANLPAKLPGLPSFHPDHAYISLYHVRPRSTAMMVN